MEETLANKGQDTVDDEWQTMNQWQKKTADGGKGTVADQHLMGIREWTTAGSKQLIVKGGRNKMADSNFQLTEDRPWQGESR